MPSSSRPTPTGPANARLWARGRFHAGGIRLLRQGQAPVAQLDRALPSEGRGHRCESCRARQRYFGDFDFSVSSRGFRDRGLRIGHPCEFVSGDHLAAEPMQRGEASPAPSKKPRRTAAVLTAERVYLRAWAIARTCDAPYLPPG